MKLTIKITKEVLKESMFCPNGINGSCLNAEDFEEKKGIGFNCAIGNAVSKILLNAWVSTDNIQTYESFEYLENGDPSFRIPLPLKAKEFIKEFDQKTPNERIKMQEMSFEIDVPEALIDRIGINQVHAILKASKTLSIA